MKRVFIFSLKITIALLLLFWLYHTGAFNLDSLKNIYFDIRSLLLSSLAIIFVILALSTMSLRLYVLLHGQHVSVSFFNLFGLTLIGALFSNMLPGLVAGDLIKAGYLCKGKSSGRSRILAAVILDRAIGLYVLLSIGACAWLMGITFGLLPDVSTVFVFASAIVLLLGLFLLILFIVPRGNITHAVSKMTFLPHQMRSVIQSLLYFIDNIKVVTIAIILSGVSQTLIIAVFFIASVLIHDELNWFYHFLYNPIAMAMNAVPLTPGGLGVSESMFSYLYSLSGSDNGAVIGLLGRFLQYIVFLFGGIIALLVTKINVNISSLPVPSSKGDHIKVTGNSS